MNFGLAINLSVEIGNKSGYIQSLSEELELYIKDKYYGADIKNFFIGIICVSPKFDFFYKETKAKYTKGVKIINPDGIPFKMEDNFEYNIKIDYESFRNATEEEARKILSRDILSSLIVFEKFKSKIKDFDIDGFRTDLERYFKDYCLIS